METLGIRLKALRKEKGLTLEQIANDFDTTAITISRYENGVREPKSDTLNLLADYFNVSVDYLLGRTHKRNGLSNQIEPDVKIAMDSITKELQVCGSSLMFDGEPMNQDELDSFLDSLELVVAMAKKKQEARLKDK
ncbi:MAG: helix-turn-helix domain-containing protein [Romboutsia sp.]|uniref:helix-turn-helix domain-containing protein n=1 Tax=Romboutsia sp. TaxID=1965302 RepID=UPI003F37F57D